MTWPRHRLTLCRLFQHGVFQRQPTSLRPSFYLAYTARHRTMTRSRSARTAGITPKKDRYRRYDTAAEWAIPALTRHVVRYRTAGIPRILSSGEQVCDSLRNTSTSYRTAYATSGMEKRTTYATSVPMKRTACATYDGSGLLVRRFCKSLPPVRSDSYKLRITYSSTLTSDRSRCVCLTRIHFP